MERAVATEVHPWARGEAFFNSTYPVKYAFNFLRVDDLDGATVAELAESADAIQGPAGLQHRRINAFGTPAGLKNDFEKAGWEVSRLIFMKHDGSLRERGAAPVETIELGELQPAMIEWDLAEGNTPEVARMLAASREALPKAADVTFLTSRVEGEIAGWCEVYVRDAVVQVENVMTLPAYRNRGIASSLVNHGVRLGYDSGADLGFLIADEDDWPKDLYVKLGFTTIGTMWEATLTEGLESP